MIGGGWPPPYQEGSETPGGRTMTKIKTVIWRTIDVPEWEVADFLTKANFQPGKFHLLRRFPGRVCIVYVEREV